MYRSEYMLRENWKINQRYKNNFYSYVQAQKKHNRELYSEAKNMFSEYIDLYLKKTGEERAVINLEDCDYSYNEYVAIKRRHNRHNIMNYRDYVKNYILSNFRDEVLFILYGEEVPQDMPKNKKKQISMWRETFSSIKRRSEQRRELIKWEVRATVRKIKSSPQIDCIDTNWEYATLKKSKCQNLKIYFNGTVEENEKIKSMLKKYNQPYAELTTDDIFKMCVII